MQQKQLIVLATSNVGKVKEIEKAFDGLPVELVPLSKLRELSRRYEAIPEPEETGSTFMENALLKARYYSEITGLPALADDSGLEVDVLGGEPGIYSARYAGRHGDDNANNELLLQKLSAVGGTEWQCVYKCALALVFFDEHNAKKPCELTSEGVVEGVIRNDARGTSAFGYDPYFYTANGKTMAELTLPEKDAISHRGAALHRLRAKLAAMLANG